MYKEGLFASAPPLFLQSKRRHINRASPRVLGVARSRYRERKKKISPKGAALSFRSSQKYVYT